jgi:hypothetical protein
MNFKYLKLSQCTFLCVLMFGLPHNGPLRAETCQFNKQTTGDLLQTVSLLVYFIKFDHMYTQALF